MIKKGTLTAVADEESSYTIRLIFYDEDGVLFVPATLVWSLSAVDGQIINSRYKVVPSAIASTTYVTLSGDDLQLVDKKSSYEDRIFTISGTYNSTYGNNLPFNKEYHFKVRNLQLIAGILYISTIDVAFTNDFVYDAAVA